MNFRDLLAGMGPGTVVTINRRDCHTLGIAATAPFIEFTYESLSEAVDEMEARLDSDDPPVTVEPDVSDEDDGADDDDRGDRRPRKKAARRQR